MDQCLHSIVVFLSATRRRATYGAVAELCGGIAQGIGARLGAKRPEACWIVNTETGRPTGYSEHEMDPAFNMDEEPYDSGGSLVRAKDWWYVDLAVQTAARAHSGQTQKNGQPCILHPLELMARFEDPVLKAIAVLHDVVEDTPVTLNDLREAGFSDVVLNGVNALSRRDDETYDDFIERASRVPEARVMKIEDVAHNLNIMRLDELREKDIQRISKYHRAWKRLTTTAAPSLQPASEEQE